MFFRTLGRKVLERLEFEGIMDNSKLEMAILLGCRSGKLLIKVTHDFPQ